MFHAHGIYLMKEKNPTLCHMSYPQFLQDFEGGGGLMGLHGCMVMLHERVVGVEMPSESCAGCFL